MRYDPAYTNTLDWIIEEFTIGFGGCTVIENIPGYYQDTLGRVIDDRVSIVYTDTPLSLLDQYPALMSYTEHLKIFLTASLFSEEAVFIAVVPVYHLT